MKPRSCLFITKAPLHLLKKIKKIAKNDIADYETVALLDIPLDAYDRLVGPDTNEPGSLTEPRAFNLMFKTFVGPVEENSNVAYSRPNRSGHLCPVR